MNFLEIVQYAARESLVIEPGLPSTVVSQEGRLNNLVYYCANEWKRIQNLRPDWKWMRRRTSFSTSAVAVITSFSAAAIGITRFGSWMKDRERSDLSGTWYSFTYYLTSDGVAYEQQLPFMEYDLFNLTYLRGTQTAAPPQAWSIDPQTGYILIGPPSDAIYTIKCHYIIGEQTLSANTDEPEFPTKHHPMIAWGALRNFVRADEAPASVVENAKDMYDDFFRALDREQYEQYEIGGQPIA